ncbi:hypothetical protein [Chitinophaga sp. S165]|uniref:hypothetical protein n=1 Tax=Chitinophaga sp. S165 TaxID=2135462 RepID=UPI0011B6298E|nr:hypothetical protein [Chitinophaga sp. S165]
MAFIVGAIIALIGTILLIFVWDQVALFARFAIAGFLIIGSLAVRAAIKKYFKNKTEEEHPSHGQMKQVYSGVLSHTEVIKQEYVRYHFNGFTVDAWIAAPNTGHPKPHFSYVPITEQFATMTNVHVTLSVTQLEPGINVVIGIHYDQQYYTESQQPMDVEDKKKLLKSGRNSAGCFIYGAAFCFILFNVVSKFNFNTFLVTLVLFVIPALFCIRHLYRTAGKNVQADGYKFIIKTIITEKLNQRIPSSDNDRHYHYLRLGSGWLTEVTGAKSYKSKCNPGDEIVLEYEVRKSGGKGTLLEIRNA